MNNFVIEGNFLVLALGIRQTKPDDKGNRKEYGSISLYCQDTDEFQKIMIFDDYKEILGRYDVMKTFKMKIQISIVTKENVSKTYMKIL